ncbi:MAG: uncharacterized protein JWR75_1758 [Devosia sp.]|nr:uncharacterized protein [Devosia sp.]
MGHVRLGRLPASRKWKEVIGYLSAADFSAAELAEAVASACDQSLERNKKDPALIEALWLLIRIPQAAKSKEFADALRELGVFVGEKPTVLDVVVGFDAAIEAVQKRARNASRDLGQMAREAGVTALWELASGELPPLWAAHAEDVRTAFAKLASTTLFSELAHRFFGELLTRNLKYYTDREMPRHIGPEQAFASASDHEVFDRMLARHCDESAVIIRTFMKEWLGKTAFHLGKDIHRKDVEGLTVIAFDKVRNELRVRSTVH